MILCLSQGLQALCCKFWWVYSTKPAVHTTFTGNKPWGCKKHSIEAGWKSSSKPGTDAKKGSALDISPTCPVLSFVQSPNGFDRHFWTCGPWATQLAYLYHCYRLVLQYTATGPIYQINLCMMRMVWWNEEIQVIKKVKMVMNYGEHPAQPLMAIFLGTWTAAGAVATFFPVDGLKHVSPHPSVTLWFSSSSSVKSRGVEVQILVLKYTLVKDKLLVHLLYLSKI